MKSITVKLPLDRPAIDYLNMGPWPIFVGFTTSRKAFAREMQRLAISPAPNFLGSAHANATTHIITGRAGGLVLIVTMQKPGKKRPVEQVASLIAHEAVHCAQEAWRHLGERNPGAEAEAYLVQHITQECMQLALETGRSRRTCP